ncbi:MULTISPECIES: glycerol-3-phosphate 1-O-acyltransferase PlsY [Bartonella]|uniref:Glycerol-3-phosphate acyltransferase n=1 Tax=Bartonella choladocola TaxID=2750995 RepID=A0A1U9MI49_9HYPH|nr:MULTISPECIES: glycerol-3-phosphate 1-O-acyltransferase PlsY [Bartonella]AQT47403.1 acyl-phosphate glycerol-3-phosphate acyltransferase [Bartonella choladocola]MBH9975567.1 glycerol-3-phosphate 1-O-acyltransferase PlsY [Bartonella choladocola]MBI0015174.1 glycerol-3-phosphate 1-O-acyltransferase PlsY [Bartonella sp. B10834G3]
MADIALSPKMVSWLTLLICYLIGSIPFGLLFTRLAGLGDVRKIGSGNIGATNVLRTGNKKIALLTLLCDMFKGTLAVYIAFLLSALDYNNIVIVTLGGFAAFIGHLYPVWLKFKGGKGVATYLGVCLGFYPPAALVFICVWLLTAFVTRYSSLSALFAVILVPIFIWLFMDRPSQNLFAIVLSFMSVIVILKHHANIRRLLTGNESKIGSKK